MACETTPEPHPTPHENSGKNRWLLSVATLGVVYGDIGTSPLYAFRECLAPERAGLTPTTDHVLSVLSLVFWALTLVVVVKYLSVVLRADNHGEGGILALLALLLGRERDEDDQAAARRRWQRTLLTLLGIFGTALLLADGMITPAISVLSAVEGLEVAAPQLDTLIVPITVFILTGLFMVQKFGTEKIARFFGPIMLLWFACIGVMGLLWILRYPEILVAVNPWHAIRLFVEEPWKGLALLGAVVLFVTGAEALYADMGHFGREPIRRSWYTIVFPCLLLNYFGQGALVVSLDGKVSSINVDGQPETINLFFEMAGPYMLYPLLGLATLATIIASQALISGAYSLAEQAVQLGYLPRLTIIHTSREVMGQIYVPFVNWLLMIACILLVVQFRDSAALADAYGVAVICTMLITTILMFQVMRSCWSWSLPAALGLTLLFLAVDLPFFVGNLAKVATGGWVPLLVGAVLFTLMTTWQRGRAILYNPANSEMFHFPLELFAREIKETKPNRDAETAVFLTGVEDMVPMSLLRMYERTRVLPCRIVLFTVKGEPVPRVAEENMVEVREYGLECYGVTARTGFLQDADMTRFLEVCKRKGLELDPCKVYFYLSRMTLMVADEPGMATWRKIIFAFMYHNARPATSYYHLPADRVVELGRLIEF